MTWQNSENSKQLESRKEKNHTIFSFYYAKRKKTPEDKDSILKRREVALLQFLILFYKCLTFKPSSWAFFATRPAPSITLGFDVFVQLVIAAITTLPCFSSAGCPWKSNFATLPCTSFGIANPCVQRKHLQRLNCCMLCDCNCVSKLKIYNLKEKGLISCILNIIMLSGILVQWSYKVGYMIEKE